MQPRELNEQRVVRRSRLDRAHVHSERRHLRAHRMLRNNGQRDHYQNAKRSRRRQARKRPGPREPRHQDHNPTDNPDQVHPKKPIANHGPSLIPASQNPKRPRRHHKTEEHVAPQPQTQSQELHCPQKVHHHAPRSIIVIPDRKMRATTSSLTSSLSSRQPVACCFFALRGSDGSDKMARHDQANTSSSYCKSASPSFPLPPRRATSLAVETRHG